MCQCDEENSCGVHNNRRAIVSGNERVTGESAHQFAVLRHGLLDITFILKLINIYDTLCRASASVTADKKQHDSPLLHSEIFAYKRACAVYM